MPLSAVLELLEVEPDLTPAAAAERLGMGDRCGMCIPYIALTVETRRAEHQPIRPSGRRGSGDRR